MTRIATTKLYSLLLLCCASVLLSCGDSDGGPAGDAGPSADARTGSCIVGDIGCPCEGNVCTDGECVGGTCADCTRGEEGCVCMSNGSCDSDLVCKNDVCEGCAIGTEDCPCDGGSCDADLVCINDVCAVDSCKEGVDGCPCATDDPRCDDTLYCDANDVCRTCATDVPGCPCDADGNCGGKLICDNDMCRALVKCADLIDDGKCAENQLCEDFKNKDAECTADTCIEDYFWDRKGKACIACVSEGCLNEPSCSITDPNSINDQCSQEFKECVEDTAGARCEGCVSGAVMVGDRCIPQIQCGGKVCEDDEYCDSDSESCKALPCPLGEAQTASTTCEKCTISCDANGLTGRPWPFQNDEDECICETAPNYFMPTDSNTVPERCDADRDGWVRQEADTPQVNNDDAHRQNARCTILSVNGVLLRDEYGIEMEVGSCGTGEGLVFDPEGTGSGDCQGTRIPMRLLETQRNDVPGEPMGVKAPVYDHLAAVGSGGRLLVAAELNSLTKACVTAIADYNDNGQDDNTEEQTRPASIDDDDQHRLQTFSYFTELYRAWYQDPPGSGPGKLVIAERSRCDADFPFKYDDSVDAVLYSRMDNADNGTYWRSCYRRRDASFDDNGVGFDFAQWTCGDTTGTCTAVAPPAHETLDANTFTATDQLLRGHGLCELGGNPPADGQWRGMGHHSQFKCVQIAGIGDAGAGKYVKGDFEGSDPAMILNICEATEDTEPSHSGSDSYAPVITCSAHDPMSSVPAEVTVAWAAVNYIDYGEYGSNTTPTSYTRGCVSEDAEYAETWLCQEPQFVLELYEEADSFGRYSCGEDQAFLWADDGGTNHNYSSTLWWDGPNGANPSVNSVLR